MKRLVSFILIASLVGVFLVPYEALASSQTFFSSGSWTAPAGVTSATIYCVGGGGGGGAFLGGGGGGGGGQTFSESVTPGNSYGLDVGGGGAGGTGTSDGSSGGQSDFDGACAAPGGAPGVGDFGAGGDNSGQGIVFHGGNGFDFNNGGLPGAAASPQTSQSGQDGAGAGNPGDGGQGDTGGGDGSSGFGGYVQVTWTISAPSTPTGLAATSGLNQHVPLTWSASTGVVDGYRLYRSDDGYTFPIFDGNALSYDNVGLVNGTTYSYEVSAYNVDAESAKSSPVSATPAGAPPPPPVSFITSYSVSGDW